MLIYLYMVKRKKVVARTLAPGSRGEKKARFSIFFFNSKSRSRFRRTYLIGKELAMWRGTFNAGACKRAATIYRAITVH